MSRPTVLLAHRFPPENGGGVAALERAIRAELPDVRLERATDYGDVAAKIPEAEILIEHRLDGELLETATALEWIQSLSSGHDRFDLEALSEEGIALTTVSGVHADPIAQHVLGFLLTFERGLLRARRQQRRREWRRFAPADLGERTVGVVGVGSVGSRVAELCEAFGSTVLGVKRDLESVPDAVEEIYPPSELHTVLGRAEYAVAACPLTERTRGLFDAAAFASMGPESVFVNVARGELTEEEALIEALGTGTIRGAALDVAAREPLPPSSPLWEFENVLLTPHMAGGSPRFAERCASIFATNYERYVDGDPEGMVNRVV